MNNISFQADGFRQKRSQQPNLIQDTQHHSSASTKSQPQTAFQPPTGGICFNLLSGRSAYPSHHPDDIRVLTFLIKTTNAISLHQITTASFLNNPMQYIPVCLPEQNDIKKVSTPPYHTAPPPLHPSHFSVKASWNCLSPGTSHSCHF